MTVFSLDFSAVACRPDTNWAPAANALTKCRGVLPTAPERRLVLPSMASLVDRERIIPRVYDGGIHKIALGLSGIHAGNKNQFCRA